MIFCLKNCCFPGKLILVFVSFLREQFLSNINTCSKYILHLFYTFWIYKKFSSSLSLYLVFLLKTGKHLKKNLEIFFFCHFEFFCKTIINSARWVIEICIWSLKIRPKSMSVTLLEWTCQILWHHLNNWGEGRGV